MRTKQFISNILIILILGGLLGFAAWQWSLQQTPEYLSTARLMVIQSQESSFDPSSSTRAAEKIASNLSAVILTEDFLNHVLSYKENTSTAETVLKHPIPREQWHTIVTASSEGSFIVIQAYHENRQLASDIASTAAAVLNTQSQRWHGGGESVFVNITDSPETSDKPVRPKPRLNALVGVLVGVIFGIALITYRQFAFFQTKNNPK